MQGDAAAVTRARRAGAAPRDDAANASPGLDTVAYHAAAGLVANGAAALAAVGRGAPREGGGRRATVAPKMLGPLLRSVAENVEALGFPEALTGPVRRGDAAGLEKHLGDAAAKLPEAVALYLAAAEAQLPLARAIGDAPGDSFDAMAAVLARASAVARGPCVP